MGFPDANVTITEGHGGTYPTGLNFQEIGMVPYIMEIQMLLYTLMREYRDTTRGSYKCNFSNIQCNSY